MNQHIRLPVRAARGFTLIELLASMAVLSLLLTVILQITQATLQTSHSVSAQMDGTQAGRKILDSLISDLAGNVRTGTAAILYRTTANGSPELAFLATGRGPIGSTPPRFVAVAYGFAGNKVRRAYEMVSWDSDDLRKASAAAGVMLGDDSQVSHVADGVLQVAMLGVLENGEFVTLSGNPNGMAWGSRVDLEGLGEWTLIHPSTSPVPRPLTAATARIEALYVAVAMVNEANFQLINPAAHPLFQQPVTDDPIAEWEGQLASKNDLPAPVRAAIRFQHVIIPLL